MRAAPPQSCRLRALVLSVHSQRLKHLKQKYWETKGSTMMIPASVHYSNVNLIDPTSGLPTRVGKGYLDDGTKVRISKRSGAIIPKPAFIRPRPKNIGESSFTASGPASAA